MFFNLKKDPSEFYVHLTENDENVLTKFDRISATNQSRDWNFIAYDFDLGYSTDITVHFNFICGGYKAQNTLHFNPSTFFKTFFNILLFLTTFEI